MLPTVSINYTRYNHTAARLRAVLRLPAVVYAITPIASARATPYTGPPSTRVQTSHKEYPAIL